MLAESFRFVSPGVLGPGDEAKARLDKPALPQFRAIYDEHFDFVWRFAAHRGVPQAALDDVVQEVFVVVNQRLPTFEGRSALRTWIAGITRHVVRGYVRKRGNVSVGEPLQGEETYASDAPTPAEALERKSAGQLLDIILSHMTELQRETFILCEMEGLSAAEMAETLGANEHTVRTRLRDARKVFEEVSTRLAAQVAWSTRSGRSQP